MSRIEASLRGLLALRALRERQGHEPAAQSLGLTRSALSHRIAELERTLGCTLVARKGRASTLTEEGLALLAATRPALSALEAAIEPFTRRRHEVRLSTVNTFAANWLAPRLAALRLRHPDIDLMIATSQDMISLDEDDFDCAIRHGLGDWPDVVATLLFRGSLVPVAAADLIVGPVAKWSLIRARTRPGDWAVWSQGAGQAISGAAHGLVVQNRAQALEAALAGAGVALTDQRFVTSHIAAGRLRQCGPVVAMDEGYFFVRSARRPPSPQLGAVEGWLLAEAKAPVASAPAAQANG